MIGYFSGQSAAKPAGLRSIQIGQISISQNLDVPTFIVEGFIPDSCAQLAIVTYKIHGDLIDIKLQATPTNGNCTPKDRQAPFLVEIPILSEECLNGTYRIGINGVPTDMIWQAPISLCEGQ